MIDHVGGGEYRKIRGIASVLTYAELVLQDSWVVKACTGLYLWRRRYGTAASLA
jgi:hypothetical protein